MSAPAQKAAPKKAVAPKKATAKKVNLKFTVDCTKPVDDEVFDAALFEKFLHDRIKVNGKAGNLGDNVKIVRDKSKIHVNSTVPFSKRYLKYLTKKYLKNQKLRDWLHVVAVSKANYEIRYYNIQEDAAEAEDAGEQ
eukprot:TRINITY_DN16_c1_g1_i1.p2 TRINITY_DN16_c1_g1~~TRINITY_DN16_c1_g1_i1.p2  ORF type:complete len:137 (-),score=57.32 TRINITY_DN16_c1_g1_i1:107-517(-)